MGNSGSGHNISGHNNIDSQSHQNNADFIFPRSPSQLQLQQIQKHQESQHHSQKWSQKSHINSLPTQVKVLPELKSGPTRLRPTNNGCILQNGGTISGRKDSTTSTAGVNVFRSPSVSSDKEPVKHTVANGRLMQRSHTQLDISLTKRNQQHYHQQQPIMEILPINFKRFDSEPNLSDDKNNNKIPKAMETNTGRPAARKKRAAPPAPVNLTSTNPVAPMSTAAQQKQRISAVDYDPRRFGWKSDDPRNEHTQSKITVPPQPPRKLRLFKTKAETTKKLPELTGNKPIKSQLEIHTENIKRMPINDNIALPKFRREKSFDISLLLMNKQNQPETTTITNKYVKPQKSLESANKSHAPLKTTKYMPTKDDKKDSGNVMVKSFKDELLAATRRRSMAMVEDDNKINRMLSNDFPVPTKHTDIQIAKRSASVPKKCANELNR